MRRRSSATAASASSRRVCSSCSMSRRWLRSVRPRVKVNTLAIAHGCHEIPASGASLADTVHSTSVATAAMTTALVHEPRYHAV